MSTGSRFEQPSAPPRPDREAPQPDERERAELINRQVDLLLKAGLSRSAQQAADYVVKHERLLDLNFAEEFGHLAERAVEEAIGDVLGAEYVADAPIPTDRERPAMGQNPEGHGQADFFLLTDPHNEKDRKQIGVQMFLRGTAGPRRAREICETKVRDTVAQAYVSDLEGIHRIPLGMASPDFHLLKRASEAWREHGRRGSLADALSPREKKRLTEAVIDQVGRSLGLQAKLHADQPELVAIYQQAQDRLDTLRERMTAQKKTDGRGVKSAPPADRERSPSATAPG